MNLELISASENHISIINNLMRKSKAHWGYDDDFMKKFMSLFQVTANYLETSITKLLYNQQQQRNHSESIIGFYSFSLDINNGLELDNFFVSPDSIGKGFGKCLWGYAVEECKPLGKKEFVLWSDPYAEMFYEKMGCVKIGIKPSPMMPNRRPAIFKYYVNT